MQKKEHLMSNCKPTKKATEGEKNPKKIEKTRRQQPQPKRPLPREELPIRKQIKKMRGHQNL